MPVRDVPVHDVLVRYMLARLRVYQDAMYQDKLDVPVHGGAVPDAVSTPPFRNPLPAASGILTRWRGESTASHCVRPLLDWTREPITASYPQFLS